MNLGGGTTHPQALRHMLSTKGMGALHLPKCLNFSAEYLS